LTLLFVSIDRFKLFGSKEEKRMNIYVLGVNYKITPIEIREKLCFSEGNLIEALNDIKADRNVEECVILSTCNRSEVYIYSGNKNLDRKTIEQLLCNSKKIDPFIFKKYFYFYQGDAAIYHTFKVAVGLDSMVLGEDQILGQVKSAHRIAMDQKTSGAILNTLFRDAVTSAKAIKTNTKISQIPTSVASIAIRKVYDIFGGLESKNVLIIGLGQTGSLTVNQLKDYGAKKIYVTNRTHGKAEDIANRYEAVEVVEYTKRYHYLDEVDIIISSTKSPHYTITADLAKSYIKSNKKRIFLDLSLPRDIDEDVKGIENTTYINIDDLKMNVLNNENRRYSEIKKAEEIIYHYILEFERWLENRMLYWEV